LVDRRQFVPQPLVQIIKDSRLTFHDHAPAIETNAGQSDDVLSDYNNSNLAGYRHSRTLILAELASSQVPVPSVWAVVVVTASASFMMRRIVRAHRPHWALQPRQ
jgi:hypothetical protein